MDSDGNATHAVNGPLGTNGLLDVAGVGTFAKHFIDLLATERNKDLVLGQDTGTAATTAANADVAVFTGNKADYTLTKIDFASAHEGTITAYKIVDNRAGSPDGTDLLVGIEKLQFADQTVSLIIQAPVLDLHTADSGNYRDEFSSSSFGNSDGSQPWAGTPWVETGDGANTAGAGQIQIDGGGGGGTNQLRFLGGVGAAFDGASIQRTVNLAGVTSATLSYTFDRNNIDSGETVTVQFAADGVNFNQTVQTITNTSGGSGGSGTTTVALTGPFTATSAIRFVATSINATDEDVRIDNVNIAFVKPVSDGLNYTTSYTENGAALPIAVNPGITDDGTVIVSAKAVLTNAVAGDRLTISGGLPAGISSSLTSVAGVITLALTGSATLAQYQTALAQIRFDSTSDNPTGADRTINVTVNDGFVDSNVAVATVHVTPVNDAPTAGNDRIVTNIALGTMFTVPDSALLANDADPDSTLTISGVSGVSGLTIPAHPAGGPVSITDTGSAGGNFNYTASDGSASDTASVTVVRDADGTLTGNDSNSTADILVGDGTGTNFDGGTGNDVIMAGGGNDTILYTMGDGADRVDGEAGSDTLAITDGGGSSTLDIVLSGSTIIGFEGGTLANVESVTAALGNGTDTLSYAGTATALNVNLGTNTATGFTSASGIDNVVGGSASDNFVGSADGNVFTGGGGNDTIDGAGGTDTAVFSGTAADHAFSLVDGNLVVSDLRVGNPDGTDTLTNIEQLQLGAQTLTLQLGTALANTLNATGNDDLLIGFAGNDTFAFGSAGNADGDVILDFTAGQDHIDVSAIDASSLASGNNAFTFIDHSNPGDTPGTGITALGQLSYYLDGATGHYMLAGNTTGSTTPEFMIDLGTLHKTLSAADFVL
jgi:Bacterial Ig domain/RTX calcium-binding nonapeptide repeat (4 copies)